MQSNSMLGSGGIPDEIAPSTSNSIRVGLSYEMLYFDLKVSCNMHILGGFLDQ